MSDEMLGKIRRLINSKDICVLATASGDKPHCSLMGYVASEDCREVYMVTGRDTTKYKNLNENPRVSLLIDTREEHPVGSRQHAMALTVDGRFHSIGDEKKRRRIGEAIKEKQPHLRKILDQPDAEIICVKIRSFLLLDGVSDACFVEVG